MNHTCCQLSTPCVLFFMKLPLKISIIPSSNGMTSFNVVQTQCIVYLPEMCDHLLLTFLISGMHIMNVSTAFIVVLSSDVSLHQAHHWLGSSEAHRALTIAICSLESIIVRSRSCEMPSCVHCSNVSLCNSPISNGHIIVFMVSLRGQLSYTYRKQIIWKKGSFRNRENLQYKKTADLVLLSLCMRTNGKCNNSHAP